MFSFKSKNTLLLLLAALFIAGCSEAPVERETAARAALESARQAEAVTYAAATWAQAEEAMKRAEAELASQNNKLGFLRSYGKSGEILEEARSLAETAAGEAATAKETLRQETQAALDQARSEVAATVEMLNAAPRGKDTRAEIESMTQELAGLQTALDEAAGLVATDQFSLAQAGINQAAARAQAIKNDLQAALAKIGSR